MSADLILIVEDEPDLLNLFKRIISRKDSHYEVLTANGGAEALRILAAQTPALVILDLAMPHVSGNDVIAYIRSQTRLDQTQVVLATAVPMRLDEENVGRVVQVLVKPFSPMILEEVVNKLLGG